MLDYNEFFCGLKDAPGVYGLFSVPEMEKSKLLSYISNLYILNDFNRPMIITLEKSASQWRNDMIKWGLQTDGVFIEDDLCYSSPKKIEELVVEKKPSIIMIHSISLMRFDGFDIMVQLDRIAKKHSIPIVVEGDLSRSTGDKDPMYRRPELFDVIRAFNRELSLNQFLDEYNAFHSIILMHRNHDCDRRIGGTSRYNVGNMAELKVYNKAECFSLYLDFRSLFDFYTLSEEN